MSARIGWRALHDNGLKRTERHKVEKRCGGSNFVESVHVLRKEDFADGFVAPSFVRASATPLGGSSLQPGSQLPRTGDRSGHVPICPPSLDLEVRAGPGAAEIKR